ncbi:damage-control phosphatase ARMT1 family protein [Orenia marismortui]|uniref:damage-control phosphatase ARMT1 family protein n=1 Tax=Orenia marismortui TaxID=46469 RepID=UPI00036A4B01|nr:ARMT1-like domain-containing protein [Orenia marismortui]
MELRLDCLPCIFRQTLEGSRMATEDEALIREILNEYAQLIPKLDSKEKAPAIVGKVHQIIKEKTGVADPYQKFKEEHMKLALNLYPKVKKIIKDATDSLQGALIMAATGNSIDAGLFSKVNIKDQIEDALENGFVQSDFELFKEKLKSEAKVLIIGDNAGEAIFDKLLIKELNKFGVEITYATREVPVLNDVSIKEAKEIGLDQISKLISSGCKTPGTILNNTTQEFRLAYQQADIIISKGQGNLEGLSSVSAPIFFLLKAKCNLVARILDVNEGDLVFRFKKQKERLD